MKPLVLCRAWLPIIASAYAAEIGRSPEKALVDYAANGASELWYLAPWHLRFLVGGAEMLASVWVIFYRLLHLGRHDPAAELRAFAHVPVISAPLLRLYRSLVAMHWYEQPEIYASSIADETPERRQDIFRHKRAEAFKA